MKILTEGSKMKTFKLALCLLGLWVVVKALKPQKQTVVYAAGLAGNFDHEEYNARA